MSDAATQPSPLRPKVTPLSFFTAAGMLIAYAWWTAPAKEMPPPPVFTAEEREAGLDRVLEEVDLNSGVLMGSLERLSRAAAEVGVRVEISPGLRADLMTPPIEGVPAGFEGKLSGVSVRDALEVLRSAVFDSRAFRRFDYRAEHGMIYLAEPKELKSVRVYEVGHLCRKPKADDGLAEVIQTFIDIESWSVNGGTCWARHVGDQLVVVQTPENHRRIEEFLYMLGSGDAEGGR